MCREQQMENRTVYCTDLRLKVTGVRATKNQLLTAAAVCDTSMYLAFNRPDKYHLN